MNAHKRISKVYESATLIPFNDNSRIVIMSDCHRGDGSYADNFAKNQNLFFAALNQYYYNKYTYIELGDGDELWENRKLSDIVDVYSNIYWLLSKFYQDDRLYMMFGNHDIIKGKKECIKKSYYNCHDVRGKKFIPLFPNIEIYEGLILCHTKTGNKIFLVHGHQADFLNHRLWKLSCFLVRYIWKPLELIGINDPTSAAKNYKRKKRIEKVLIEWVKENNQMLIAGHTHRPVLPDYDEPPYFNDGSCVHPRCITAIEIVDGNILLVKWCYMTKFDGTLYVGREVLVGPKKLKEYFKNTNNEPLVNKT
ncbi:MAG: serine/threonine protein phosphatase [Clostridiales bacterium]|jgi:UDP-2,3-diacylglucosamine pyrophosphatase LpxH|nr:serine/threonine protein phosphatase [Clostridiales bacterium]